MFPNLPRLCGRLSPLHLSAVLFLVVSSGCATFPDKGSSSLSKAGKDDTSEITRETSAVSMCTVELRTNKRRSETVDVPLTEDTRVQDVLDASRATAKIRHPDVTVFRPTSNPAEPMLKLACQFNRRTRRMSIETDYALLPGDRVVVREDTSGGLDKVLSSMLGPVLGGR